jgi:hypothetical protein
MKIGLKRYFCALLFASCVSLFSFGQVIQKMQPDTLYTNALFLTPEQIESFNSPESISRCEEIYSALLEENREASDAELEQLSYCDEIRQSLWDIIDGGCSWYCGGAVEKVYASSSLPDQGEYSYSAENCYDLSYKTPWIESVEGYGIGESITYVFRGENPRITSVIIVNGIVLSEDAWFENARVKTLIMYVNEKKYAILHLKDSKNDQVFRFDPIGTSNREDWDAMTKLPDWTIRFEIAEIYEGDIYDDTAISEIYFDGIDVH